jgi:hypothetical protein
MALGYVYSSQKITDWSCRRITIEYPSQRWFWRSCLCPLVYCFQTLLSTQWLKEKVQKDKQRNVLLMVSVFNNFSVMSIVINRYIRERTDMMNWIVRISVLGRCLKNIALNMGVGCRRITIEYPSQRWFWRSCLCPLVYCFQTLLSYLSFQYFYIERTWGTDYWFFKSRLNNSVK